ncbi:MAG: hypothetical protein ACRD0K_11235 [Egibacteraceae bacterium]
MERWTYEELHELHEVRGRPTYEAFANWLHMSPRSIRRWLTKPDERPNMELSRRIDAHVRMEVHRRHPRLPVSRVEYMDRRSLLRVLAVGVAAPIGGMSMDWDASSTCVSAATLDVLEGITTALAAKYRVAEPRALLGAVTGHLEEIHGLLGNAAMQSSDLRVRLEAIGADAAIFVGGLAVQAGRLAHADAYLGLAERLARQSDSMGLVAQALEWRSLLHWVGASAQGPGRRQATATDPRPRVALLTEAESLAARHAAPVVQMGISGELAQQLAAAGDAYAADAAVERAWRAFDRVRTGDAVTGFGSTVGSYSGYGQGVVMSKQGGVELVLGRVGNAVETLTASLPLEETAYSRACGLITLARACIALDQPEEACAHLGQAGDAMAACGSTVLVAGFRRTCVSMPPEWASLACVKEMNERSAPM